MGEVLHSRIGRRLDAKEDAAFPLVRRGGYECGAVDGAIEDLGRQLRALKAERDRLRADLGGREAEVKRLQTLLDHPPLPEPAELSRLVGEEVARVLEVARHTADEMVDRARVQAGELVAAAERTASERTAAAEAERASLRAEVESEAAEVRQKAQEYLDERRREAEECAAALVAEGEEARRQAEADGILHIDGVKEEGRAMIVEAQQFREQVLRDLAGRQKLARKKLEAMRAAQERLLEAFTTCAGAVEAVTSELHSALPEARAAADRAASRVSDDIEQVVSQLEAAIQTGELPKIVTRDLDRPKLASRALPRPSDVDAPVTPIPLVEEASVPGSDSAARHEPGRPPEPATFPPAEGDGSLAAGTEQGPDGEDDVDADRDGSPAEIAARVAAEGRADGTARSDAEEVGGDDGRPRLGVIDGDRPDSDPDGDLDEWGADPWAGSSFEDELYDEDELSDEEGEGFEQIDLDEVGITVRDGQVVGISSVDVEGEPTAPHLTLVIGEAAAPVPGTPESGESETRSAEEGSPPADDTAASLFARLREESDAAMNDTRSLVDEAEVRLGAATMADDVDVLVDTRDELLVGIERDVIRRLKRVVDDGQNDLLDRLRRARRLEGAQQILGDEAAEVDSLVESMRTELGDALEAGRRFVDLVGGSTRQDGWEVDTLVSVLGPVLRQRVALPWRALVSDVVSARLEDRSSLPEALRVAVREFRSETLPQTAGAIADAAFNLGVVASAPEGCTLEWVVDHGGEPSVQHLDPPRAGATGRVVEGIAASDLPSSCRCLAVPVER